MHSHTSLVIALLLAGCATSPMGEEAGSTVEEPPAEPPVLHEGEWVVLPATIGHDNVTVSQVHVPYGAMQEAMMVGDPHPWPLLGLQVAMSMGNATSWAVQPWWSGPDGLVAAMPLFFLEAQVEMRDYQDQRAEYRALPDPLALTDWRIDLPIGFPDRPGYDLVFAVFADGPPGEGEIWIRAVADGPLEPPAQRPTDAASQATRLAETQGARVGFFADLRTSLFVSPILNHTRVVGGDILAVTDRTLDASWPATQSRDLTIELLASGERGTAFHHVSQVTAFSQTPGVTLWDLESTVHGPTIERGGVRTSRAEGTVCRWDDGCTGPLPYIGIIQSGAGDQPASLRFDLNTVRAGDAAIDFVSVAVFDIDASLEEITGLPVAEALFEIESIVPDDAMISWMGPSVAAPIAA